MARRFDFLGAGASVVTAAVYVFIALPTVVVLAISFTSAPYMSFPPPGLSLRWYATLLHQHMWTDAFGLSALLVIIVAPLTLVLATPAAYALVRGRFRGRIALSVFLVSPLMVPQVMVGLALLYYFININLINTLPTVIIGHTIVAFPFVLRVVLVSVQNLDESIERAAAVLGAPPWRVFIDVTLPMIRPGLMAGVIFAAVMSLGEAAITAFVAGPTTTTLPLLLFTHVENSIDPIAAAVSSLLILVAFPLLVAIERFVGLTRAFK